MSASRGNKGHSSGIQFELWFFCACLLATPAHSEIYKWIDENGQTHFSQEKPSHQAGGGRQQYETYIPQSQLTTVPATDKEDRVVLYSTAWCGYCKQARQYFLRQGIAFNERDIERSSSAKRAHQRLGGGGVPVIVLGDKVMRGFEKNRFDTAYRHFQSELAAAKLASEKASGTSDEENTLEVPSDISSTLQGIKEKLLNYF